MAKRANRFLALKPYFRRHFVASTPHASHAKRTDSDSHRLPWHKENGFRNDPSWKSHVTIKVSDFFLKALPRWRWSTKFDALPVESPDWNSIYNPPSELQAFWIGHATFLLQLRGHTVLTDPVFSRRASASQLVGPARYTPPACAVDDLPPIDLVLINMMGLR